MAVPARTMAAAATVGANAVARARGGNTVHPAPPRIVENSGSVSDAQAQMMADAEREAEPTRMDDGRRFHDEM